MPRFKNNRVDFVAAKRLVLFGGREFQHTLGIECRRAIKSEDDVAGEVISDTAGTDTDALAAQILEVAYAGIGPSDNGKCFRIECDQDAQLRVGAGCSEGALSMESGIGDVGLRKAKRRGAAFDASDVRHRTIGTHRDAGHRRMFVVQIKHLADRASDGMIDAAGGPGGESNRVRSEASETAMQPATALAVIAAASHSARLNGMGECPLAAG